MLTFPLRHISVRVPWHDSGWNGFVCKSPQRNVACLKLKNISENKNESVEEAISGTSFADLRQNQLPPCMQERGTFMADFGLTRVHEHPYVKNKSSLHEHFKPTTLSYPAYSTAALPFRWMMKSFVFGDEKKRVRGLVADFPLQAVSLDYEPTKDLLKFETNWLQDHRNHRTLLDCFWNHVRPAESLVFFYAKQVPLVEDIGKRVIVGVGRIKKIGALTEYEYDGPPKEKLRSLLWERMVSHTIRPDFADGFLMPYHAAMEKAGEGLNFDPATVVAFAPDDRFVEFSYATEHVSNDTAISSLLACRAALLKSQELFSVSIRKQELWIDRELGRLWVKRGPFPGIGAVLSASGVPLGNFIGHSLIEQVGEEGNPWTAWDAAIENPKKILPKELASNLDTSIRGDWKNKTRARRAYLELLSRVDLTFEQAELLVNPEQREEAGISLADSEVLANPYLLYESTRLTNLPVGVGAVDRGMFPTELIRTKFPIPAKSRIETPVDMRRVRALAVRELEIAAGVDGDTLLSRAEVVLRLRNRKEEHEPHTQITADLMAVGEQEHFSDEIAVTQFADDQPAYQLQRFVEVGKLIRTTIRKRVKGKRHEMSVNWKSELNTFLKRQNKTSSGSSDDEQENLARREKAAALAEIAASRFSVLIGPAGTGKTTLLSVLCRQTDIHDGGILLLAPTGKARVRMESMAKQAGTTNFKACTLAQFLGPDGRYDAWTQRYQLTGEPGKKVARTVIVDECSMLTEEMLAALLEAVSGVERLIFVGDSRQLPPIGAGRPFVDIIAELTPEGIETSFPRVGVGYAELTIPRRQGSGERDDLQLAAWFSGAVSAPGDDQVFDILSGKRKSEQIRFVRWDSPDELERLLPEVIAETLEFSTEHEEWQAFAASLGGVVDKNGAVWFNNTYKDRPGAGQSSENWQILSPVRQQPWGVEMLNRWIHQRYKGPQIERAREPIVYKRKIPKPMGEHQIIYGDKVINNRNWTVYGNRLYPTDSKSGYLANGEIGIVVGHRRTKIKDWIPNNLEIEFATQPEHIIKFWDSDFSEEGQAALELAYALTVHKAQGSEFGTVFLVLPRSSQSISRELIYTALTRQKQKIVVLHQGAATDLQAFSAERYSATAKRLTNLFQPPKPRKVGDSFLEERLIHLTARGEAVRSKSEVIIANLLHANGIKYHYEQPLELGGVTKFPDFTYDDEDSGTKYYWEHCGMLGSDGYRRRWRDKQQWYRDNKILPYQDGGGKNGTLIVTEDSPDGGISSQAIIKIIKQVLSA